MDSLVYPEDGIVDATLDLTVKPKQDNSIYVSDLSWYGSVGDSSLFTSEQLVALFNRAFPTLATSLASIEETPTEQRPGKKKGPSMHSTRKGFEKPKHIR